MGNWSGCVTQTHTQTHAHKKKVSFYLPICLPFLTQQPAAAARGHLGTDKQPTIDSITCHVARQKDLGGLPINSEINLCAKRFRFRGKNASYFHEFYPFLTPSFLGFILSFICLIIMQKAFFKDIMALNRSDCECHEVFIEGKCFTF